MNVRFLFLVAALAAAVAPNAQAVVNVQLNLQYADPNDESAGGTWELLAGSEAGGIAGLSILIEHVMNAAPAGGTGFAVFETQQIGTVREIVVGHDEVGLAGEAKDVGLGAGTTGNVVDDLFPGRSPAIWENNALLASGIFGAMRPSLLTTSGTFDAGVDLFDDGAVVEGALGTLSVRGDSVRTDGLCQGDANRDGVVNGDDFNLLAFSFGGAGTTWDQGNFDSMNGTDGDDFNLLAFKFIQPFPDPPPVSAVPEPTAVPLAMIACMGLLHARLLRL